MKLLLPRGVSANIVLLIWGLFGGVLVHGFLANFRSMLMMPVYEKPIDTAQDILDRGLIPIVTKEQNGMKQVLEDSPIPAYWEISKILVISHNNSDVPWITHPGSPESPYHLIPRSHVYLGGMSQDPWHHISKDKLSGMVPWRMMIMNKRWPLDEELNVHLLRFSQVCIIMIFIWMTI